MLKDITPLNNPDIGVAIVLDKNETGEDLWSVHFINQTTSGLKNVFVTCKGFGVINNEPRETATTRYFIGDVDAGSSKLIEPVDPSVFVLNNEYFITAYLDGVMIDKKVVVNENSIKASALDHLNLIHKTGISFW